MSIDITNPYVDYLNSLHNGNAANQNAIGEMQISSPFFASTQVKRPLVDFIKKKVLDGYFVILTGHAGDGKTTLLAQVLEELGRKQEVLYPSADIDCGTYSVHYVKDFSELTHDKQDAELNLCFHRSGPSILIANTGPLLGAFDRLDDNDYESALLDILDMPAGNTISIENQGDVFLLNIARVDNTDFIKPYLNNLIEQKNWDACSGCPNVSKCPILFNRNILSEKMDRASDFVEKVYTWLQEYDRRATIRQITAHLTFSMTGGLDCRTVEKHSVASLRYRYLFSNLFFGCKGDEMIPGARQIRGIQLVNEVGFDRKPTCVDYNLYNKNQYGVLFPNVLASLFDESFYKHKACDTYTVQTVIKRAYLFFGQNTEDVDRKQFGDTFSEWFDLYLRVRNTGEKPKNPLKKAICRAINTLFVGEALDEDVDHIDLTLRRNNEQTSNVQLLSGRISIDNIELKAKQIQTISEKKQYRLMFITDKIEYPISLPLLNYFCEIYHGIIITDIDPMLSNGIDSLKARLLSSYSLSKDDNEVPIVYLSGSNWFKRELRFTEQKVDH